MKRRKKEIKKYTGGFSLIELLVAMGVFMILMSIASGILIQAIRSQRAAAAMMAVNDSVGLTLEQIARDLRTGINFNRISSAEVEFVNAKGNTVSYRFNGIDGSIEKREQGSLISGEYRKITADNVRISRANFEVRHEGVDNYPPRVTISMSVTSAEPDVRRLNIFTDIQATVSVRCGSANCPSDI